MGIFCFLFSVIALLLVIYSVITVCKVKKQISEMLDVLADIKSGNGNRRILAKTHEIVAPLAYEINNIYLFVFKYWYPVNQYIPC